jgi:hypothetical protein
MRIVRSVCVMLSSLTPTGTQCFRAAWLMKGSTIMSATFTKMLAVLTIFASVVMTNGASAGPPLGISRPYYGSNRSVTGTRMRTMRNYSLVARAEVRRSFSHNPSEVVITNNGGCTRSIAVAPATPKNDVATSPNVTRRSFSYEPSVNSAVPSRSYRKATPRKDPWMIPKADFRRYSR